MTRWTTRNGFSCWQPTGTYLFRAVVVIGLSGVRVPLALIIGYSMHGIWDLLHELQMHGGHSGFEPGQLTTIPLAYGLFCAAFDFYMAAYFYERRAAWGKAGAATSH